MNPRRLWLGVVLGGTALAAGFGGLIYWEDKRIERAHLEVASLRTEIASSRKLIEGTSALERDVIVLREMSEVIKGILPDTADVNQLVHTFQEFFQSSNVQIRQVKKKQKHKSNQSTAAFEDVAYTLTLEADTFQFLDFMNLVESHSRFMRIPSFKITAAKRNQVEAQGQAQHRIQLDVETFVYEPKKDAPPVRIESYERKRDLMFGEINRKRQELVVETYKYPGARGRRDPWVDPRVPVMGDGGSSLTVLEQMEIVQSLQERTVKVLEQWEKVKSAQNVIEELVARTDMEQMLAMLEEDLRRVESEGSIRYVPSLRRLQIEVVDPVFQLRKELSSTEGSRGPSMEKLREVLEAMIRHMDREEFGLMLDTFRLVDDQLEYVAKDPLRKPFVQELQRLARIARTVIDFDKINIKVGGVAIEPGGTSVALINGRTFGVGDMLGNELLIRDIRADEIEFIFRGIVLARRY